MDFEKKESKIKSIKNLQKESEYQGRISHLFELELENGDKGTVKAAAERRKTIDDPYTYEVGTNISYEIGSNNYGTMIKGVKNLDKADGKFKSSYNDPTVIKKISKSVAQFRAIKFLAILGATITLEKIDKLTDYFYGWFIKDTMSRDEMSYRWSCVEKALEILETNIHSKNPDIDDATMNNALKKVMSDSTHFLKQIIDTKHD